MNNENRTDQSRQIARIHDVICSCISCPLAKTRNKAVPGEGPAPANIMFVGEAPGHVNDLEGRPFVGRGGIIFNSILTKCGLERSSVFITNAVKCWPPENRRPSNAELKICRQYLDEQVAQVNPKLIFALGAVAFEQLTGLKIKLRTEHGKIVQIAGRTICPIFHPNGLRYIKGGAATLVNDISGALTQTKLESGPIISPTQMILL